MENEKNHSMGNEDHSMGDEAVRGPLVPAAAIKNMYILGRAYKYLACSVSSRVFVKSVKERSRSRKLRASVEN